MTLILTVFAAWIVLSYILATVFCEKKEDEE